MFASPLALKNAAAAIVNFVKLTSDATKSIFAATSGTLSTPNTLQIGHQMTSSVDGSDRHLVKIAKTVLDAQSRPRTVVMNFTLSVPRVGPSRTDVDDVIAELKEFLVTANVDALLRGEL